MDRGEGSAGIVVEKAAEEVTHSMFHCADLRDSYLYQMVESFFSELFEPGEDFISDGVDVTVSPCGGFVGFTGTVFNDMESAPVTRVCIADLATGSIARIAAGGGSDKCPRWSPDGSRIAFLSDRGQAGNFQLHFASLHNFQSVEMAPQVEGTVEHFSWSPNGSYILLVIAGFGADIAGYQGGSTTIKGDQDIPQWMPRIDSGDGENLWRWISIVDVKKGTVGRLNRRGLNTWEAAWLGNDTVLSVASESHVEGSWYSSSLYAIDLSSGAEQKLYTPGDQIGVPVGSPDGRTVGVIEAVCSDRGIVCGKLLLIDVASGSVREVDTNAVDVTDLAWRNMGELAWAGHRAFETVVGDCDCESGRVYEQWSSTRRVLYSWYPQIWPHPDGGVVSMGQAYDVAPELVRIYEGDYQVIHSFASRAAGTAHYSSAIMEPVRWSGRDQLELHGWLVKPPGEGPFPLVMDIHGGPVWACRNRWMGNLRGCKLLADMGYASFYPNPRGSSTRGSAFARRVQGDMGGEDTYDYLTGIDYLVERGIADPNRIGVTGISYGGFMSAWLITQDSRFAAAVPISPVCNWYSQHFTSQIPYFDELMLDGSPYEPDNLYFHRSPVMHARKVKTPTLQLTGDLDQNTPPTQALEFHRALLETGVESICTFYPKAGHGIRNFPDVIDHTTRKIAWFLLHMQPDSP